MVDSPLRPLLAQVALAPAEVAQARSPNQLSSDVPRMHIYHVPGRFGRVEGTVDSNNDK